MSDDDQARGERVWFFPSEGRFWREVGTPQEIRAVVAARPDAIHVQSGCPRCLTGYEDIMADPGFNCDLCQGTGFPIFGDVSSR